jgi:hypothetical protein
MLIVLWILGKRLVNYADSILHYANVKGGNMKQKYLMGEDVNICFIGQIKSIITDRDGNYLYKVVDGSQEAWVKEEFMTTLPTEEETKIVA